MITAPQIMTKASLLGASFIRNESGCRITMPVTKLQAKEGMTTGDSFLASTPDEAWTFLSQWEELQGLRHELKKREIKEFVQTKLKTNDKWALHALEVIMAKQTVDEQRSDHTVYHNNVGFTGVDSPILSSFAKQYRDRQWLSTKQMQILKKLIAKYWSQIIDSSNELKLLRQVKAARSAIQTQLPL